MRIERQHEGVHERLEHIVRLALIHALGHVLVALAQDVDDFGPLLARDDKRERVVLDPLAPQFVHLRRVGGPGFFLAVEIERLVDVEIRFLAQQVDGIGHALAAALLVAAEDHESRFDIAGLDGIVEFVAIALELGDVAGVEVASGAVDRVEVAVEDQAGKMIVERRAAIVLARDDVRHAARDVVFLLGGCEIAASASRAAAAGAAAGGVMAAPNSAASPTALAQIAMPVNPSRTIGH